MPVSVADSKDVTDLVTLIDSAYRGKPSLNGWTSEAKLIKGKKRTDEETVTKLIKKKDAVFLKYTNENGRIEGCVLLQRKENKLYLGMLSVSPLLQSKGIGRKLMEAAEIQAKLLNCKSIFMNVISVRKELIDWYEKIGYKKNGETNPFPDDQRYGIPTQPIEFVVLEKIIN